MPMPPLADPVSRMKCTTIADCNCIVVALVLTMALFSAVYMKLKFHFETLDHAFEHEAEALVLLL